MVAVVTASACRHNKPAAYFTGKAVMTRVGFIITFLILFSLNFMLGMVCFATTEIRQITMAYSGILTILSGKLIPNWLYPEWMQAVIEILPFRCVFETPLNIYTGAASRVDIVYSLLLQAAWAAVLFLLGKIMWLGVHKHLAVQGG